MKGEPSRGVALEDEVVSGLSDSGTRGSIQVLDLPDAEVFLYPAFFSASQADRLFLDLRDTTLWRQETFTLYGKQISFPRLTAWYGDEGTSYVYSGIKNTPLPWTQAILEVKRAVEPPSGTKFNSVLLNRYRTGKDIFVRSAMVRPSPPRNGAPPEQSRPLPQERDSILSTPTESYPGQPVRGRVPGEAAQTRSCPAVRRFLQLRHREETN
jgi:hypothetical protein